MMVLRWALAVLLFAVVAACLAIAIVPRFLDRIYYRGAVSDHFDGARFFNPDGEDTLAPPVGRSRSGFLWRYLTRRDARPDWPEHVAVIRMVIGATEKFPRFGQAFYEAGPACGIGRLADYLDRQVKAGRLRAADTELAAKHFLHLCQAGLLTRLLFAAGGPPTEEEKRTRVAEAVRVFFAGYGPEG